MTFCLNRSAVHTEASKEIPEGHELDDGLDKSWGQGWVQAEYVSG